jgi:pSer/pThr/pTyr-binding forkhead associated (FHA) protein
VFRSERDKYKEAQGGFLLYLYNMNSLRYHKIVDQMVIGRNTGDLQFSFDSRMSGKHAQIIVEEFGQQEVFYIIDLGSKNKTFVDRVEIIPNEKVRINSFTLIEIGDQQFIVTVSDRIELQDLTAIFNKKMKIPISKMNEVSRSGITLPPPVPELKQMVKNKSVVDDIKEIEQQILKLEENVKKELAKYEQAKETLIASAKQTKIELMERLKKLKSN